MESSQRTILADVSMASMQGVLDQLGMLSTYAADVFDGIHRKVKRISKRSDAIARRLESMQRNSLSQVERVFLEAKGDLGELSVNKETHLDRSYGVTFNLFTPNTRSADVERQFKAIAKPPMLTKLDQFVEDKSKPSQMCKYSDPGFFFREWQKAEEARNQRELEMKKMRRRKKRRAHKQSEKTREAHRQVKQRQQHTRTTSSADSFASKEETSNYGFASEGRSGSASASPPSSPTRRPRPPAPKKRPTVSERPNDEEVSDDEDGPPPPIPSTRRARPPVPTSRRAPPRPNPPRLNPRPWR